MVTRIPIKEFAELKAGIIKTREDCTKYHELIEHLFEKYASVGLEPITNCPRAEPYFPGIYLLSRCNGNKCSDKTFIHGIIDKHKKSLPLCGIELTRSSKTDKILEKKVKK